MQIQIIFERGSHVVHNDEQPAIESSSARKGNNMFNLTVLSWLFPTEEGAKIPHSSVICFGDEISYCKSGLIRRKFSGQFSQDTITSLIEFDNVLGTN